MICASRLIEALLFGAGHRGGDGGGIRGGLKNFALIEIARMVRVFSQEAAETARTSPRW
jgi:hypothetical protein